MTTLSQKDFATAIGRDKSYITRLKQAGHLVMTEDGFVDVEPSLQRLQASTGNTAAGRAHQERWDEYRRRNAPQPPATATQPGGTGEEEQEFTQDSYANRKAKAVLEKLQADAEKARMDVAIIKKEYIRRADVIADMLTAIGVIRNAAAGQPDRVVPLMAIPDDEINRTRAILTEDMEYILETASSVLADIARDGE